MAKSIRIWTTWDDQIDCTEFTNVNPSFSGIKLTRDADEHLGSIVGVNLPHKDDVGGMIDLIDAVETWMIDNNK